MWIYLFSIWIYFCGYICFLCGYIFNDIVDLFIFYVDIVIFTWIYLLFYVDIFFLIQQKFFPHRIHKIINRIFPYLYKVLIMGIYAHNDDKVAYLIFDENLSFLMILATLYIMYYL